MRFPVLQYLPDFHSVPVRWRVQYGTLPFFESSWILKDRTVNVNVSAGLCSTVQHLYI